MPTLRLALSGLLLAIAAADAAAQAYPTRAIRMVVPFAAGGGIDIMARTLAMQLQDRLGQPVLVENKPGAGGIVGSEAVATARPDGYTLLAVPISHAANVSLAKLPFDPVKDLAPVIHLASAPNVVLVNPALPVRTLGEFVKLAQQKPGQLSYASSGNGSSTHLAGELFKMLARVELLHVPYKGGGPALTDLLGGQVNMYIGSLPASLPLLKTQKLRGLAVTSSARVASLPDVPTAMEAGVADYEYIGWYGLLAPGGTPAAVITRLNTESNRILKDPAMLEKLAADGAQPVGGTPQEFDQFIRTEIAKWAKVVKYAKMALD